MKINLVFISTIFILFFSCDSSNELVSQDLNGKKSLVTKTIYIDQIIRRHIKKHCENGCESQEVKSVFYKNRADFKSYLTFRCINDRSSLDKPELEGMNSPEFCLQSWKENNGRALA